MHGVLLAGDLAFVLSGPTLALGQDRTWEWQWGMHPMVLMWGAGGIVMMFMMLVFWGARDRRPRPWRAMAGWAGTWGSKRRGAGNPAPTLRAR